MQVYPEDISRTIDERGAAGDSMWSDYIARALNASMWDVIHAARRHPTRFAELRCWHNGDYVPIIKALDH